MPFDLAFRTQSLVWAKRLAPQVLASILARYTARELAQAWTAPDEILRLLANALPSEKAELVQGYVRRNGASRGSRSFNALCGDIASSLKSAA